MSAGVLQRAAQVIPLGIWGHNRAPALLDEGAYPFFVDHAAGARFRDVDGNEFIDYMCGFGAMINGFANPEVDGALTSQLARGDCFNQPTLRSVELAEHLCQIVRGVSWCFFAKNGSDATTGALLVARAHTGRRKVVCVRGAYHASHFWASFGNPGAGRPAEDSHDLLLVRWNCPDDVERVFRQHGDELAAVVVTPYHHPIPGAAEAPTEAFIDAIQSCAARRRTPLILDDVRAGFRLNLHGSHEHYGWRPDLICYSKALANTHALSAVAGAEPFRAAASEAFISGTFWNAGAAQAAALANLRLLERDDGISRMADLGTQLCDGLLRLGRRTGVHLRISGPASMPTVQLADDPHYLKMRRFCQELAERGVFTHPMHNWFLSAAHRQADIEETLDVAQAALEAVKAG
jgi:glutamate-1-semialdehyde 2,1-aminomutase